MNRQIARALQYLVVTISLGGCELSATNATSSSAPAEAPASDIVPPIRYRGQYTLGHEVNVFCPAINSQCYWLSSAIGKEIRETLRKLASANTSRPYDSSCVLIEAAIDRESPRDGFSADYDGLITVSKVWGLCGETQMVTQGDLQHHRWVLQSINGLALHDAAAGKPVPELDFGELMHVSGSTGCNRFSGHAVLSDNRFQIEQLASTRMACPPEQMDLEAKVLSVLRSRSVIQLNSEKRLSLESDDFLLVFNLRDWVD
ncbi:MAG: META domain-containing protein [Proteobacteria bacterium]|nr:META domain-containing protein [Pseudomonadota bacterium]